MLLVLASGMWAQSAGEMKAIPGKVKDMEKSGWTFLAVQPFQEVIPADRLNVPQEVKEDAWGLVPDFSVIQMIESQKPSLLDVQIPGPGGESITVRVYQVRVGSSAMEIRLSDGTVLKEYGGAFYRGIVAGDYNSLVALSFFDDHVRGFVSTEKGNMVLGPLEPREDRDIHIFYDDMTIQHLNPFTCHMEDTLPGDDEHFDPNPTGQRAPGDCVKIWWEVDYDIFLNKGSLGNTLNWMNGMANEVYTLYDNELLIMETNVMNIWTGPSPYSGNNSSQRLSSFQSNNGVLDGDLAHYVNLTSNYGGIAAGFSGICNANYNNSMCYSGLTSTYQNVPTYSWTIMVCTHEKGHLLGSRHTHACVWNGNNTAIDGCAGGTEGACPLPGQPAGGGTIMSYCHLNVGINFTLGFGPQPGNVIRNTINNAACLDGCDDGGSCSFTITCPVNTTVQCGPNPPPATTGNPTVTITSGNCTPSVSWSDNNNGLTGCNGTGFFVRTFTATDGFSTATCAQTITKIDNTPPVINGVPNDLTINCESPVPSPANVTATDNCGTATLTFNETTGGSGNVCGYTLIRTWTATDACNNQSVRTQTITVTDTTPPVARCKGGEVSLNNNGEATVQPAMIDDGSYDACTSITLAVNPTTLTCAQLGNAVVTLIVTDACGNVATCNATVTVRDELKPKMQCINQLEFEVDEFGTPLILTWQDIDDGSWDNCGITAWELSKDLFGCHTLGNNTVKLYAYDASGNVNECQATVRIRDLIPPSFSYIPEDITVYCDEGAAWDEPVAEDNCGVVGVHHVDTPEYWWGGPQDAYRIKREWFATDGSGNTISTIQWIAVLAEGQMVTLCNNDIQTAPAKAPVQVHWNAPKVDDICMGSFNMTQMSGPASGSYFNPGSRTRITYEYIDHWQTRYQCAFHVIVPGIEDDYQVIINQAEVDCADHELQSCVLAEVNHFSFAWTPMGSKTQVLYSLDGPATLAMYGDGTARLTGTWMAGNNGWTGDIRFYHRRDLNGWQAVGGKIFDPSGTANSVDWRFFEIDPTRTTFEGVGGFAGTNLTLKPSVIYPAHGLQIGAGANGVTPGVGGWFAVATFNDKDRITGNGEFHFGLNCTNTNRILNAAEVISLDGNTYNATWTGGVNGPVLGDVPPGTYTVNVTDAEGQVRSHTFTLTAPDDCTLLWQDACREKNVAVGAIATQGSTWKNAKASLAVDGNTDGDFDNGSVSSTLHGWQNFWWANIKQALPIESIRIWPRTDCCDAVLDPYYIFISELPIPDADPATLLATPGIRAIRHQGPMNEAWRTPVDFKGQYVKIQLAESGMLQLAEVEVLVCQPDRLDPATRIVLAPDISDPNNNIILPPADLTMWPNPGSDMVHLSLHEDSGILQSLTIQNVQGLVIYHREWINDAASPIQQIEVSTWPQGMYLLQARTDRGVINRTMAVQR